jgi:hypothetical protein
MRVVVSGKPKTSARPANNKYDASTKPSKSLCAAGKNWVPIHGLGAAKKKR